VADLGVREIAMDSGAERLGVALRQHREERGLTLETIAKRLAYVYTPTVLQMIESARYPLESDQVEDLLHSYDADPDLSVLAGGLLEGHNDHGDDESAQTVRELNQSTTAEGLLYEYLDFVYEIRGVEPGSLIPLREADLAVLGKTIGWSIGAIEDHLTNLMVLWRKADPVDVGRRSHARVSTLLSAATERHSVEWAAKSEEPEPCQSLDAPVSHDEGPVRDEPESGDKPLNGAEVKVARKRDTAKGTRGKGSDSGKKRSKKKGSGKKNSSKKASGKKGSGKKKSAKK